MFVIASGRTGNVVAETLLAGHQRARVLVRDPHRGEAWRARGAEAATVSLDDQDGLSRALDGATGFYTLVPEDLAAPDFHGRRRRVVEATAAAVEAARVPHVVLLSAGAAALPGGNGLAAELGRAETALGATGSIVTTIRASYFQENVAFALPAARGDGVFPSFLPADVSIPTIAAQDAGRLAARCLLEPPADSEVIDLVGPMYSMRDFAGRLGAALGRPLHVVEVPPAAQVEALTRAGLPAAFAEALAETYACWGSGRVQPRGGRMIASTTLLEDILPGLLSS